MRQSDSQKAISPSSFSKLRVRQAVVSAVEYLLHRDIERELQWMGRMNEVPPKLR